MLGTKVTVGFYKGKRVKRIEVRDTFKDANWRALGGIPAEALEWDIINLSTANQIDVTFQAVIDATDIPYDTIQVATAGTRSTLDPKDWRPEHVSIRGTANQPFNFYYIMAWDEVADGTENYLDALREEVNEPMEEEK
jgi:hypothetical protein